MTAEDTSRRTFIGLAGAAAGTSLLTPHSARAGLTAAEPYRLRSVGEALPGIWEQEEAVLNAKAFHRPQPLSVSGWTADKLVTQSIATALWTGRLYAATGEERRSPEFRQEVLARVDAMAETVYATAADLEAMTENQLAGLDFHIRSDPTLLDEVQENLLSEARGQGVPEHVIRRYQRAHRQAAWRLKKQGASAVVGNLVAKVDRVCRRQEVDWREEAKAAKNRDFVRPLVPDESSEKGWAEAHYEIADRQEKAGVILLGIGIPMFVLGLIGTPFMFWPVFGATVGLVLLIVGAVKLAAAARNRRRAKR